MNESERAAACVYSGHSTKDSVEENAKDGTGTGCPCLESKYNSHNFNLDLKKCMCIHVDMACRPTWQQ